MWKMRKLAKHLDHSDVMLRVNPRSRKALKIAGGRWLNELEELTKKTVIVKSRPGLAPGAVRHQLGRLFRFEGREYPVPLLL